ncbi:anti-sigma regulatory factor (Ser/Thr protein kinase) [Geothermobacter ehrlichii]|uniref:Anti-sigma regulatory factor (Ser/Thr protein kinase) n=1 Tax=Geothermobacter ehrlichii TaxID=213224 RepID=A0A5D3WFT7_9BACT|nr:ATP-binding SpoIIE family protein phosphatase [Geothermobacter ehrlichii]TYO95816.1 anti-sigma regulatory factor (Ser/Thr protein kinase) [Geothermobacter ehrlichii]
MRDQILCDIRHDADVGELRRRATAFCRAAGFDEESLGRVAIVCTELGSNIVRHAGSGGQVILRQIAEAAIPGIEIVALDHGTGMSNVERSLQDGYSTAGTCGNGLGAVQRLSDLFDIDARPCRGTAVICRIWSRPRPNQAVSPFATGAFRLPASNETVCGDIWVIDQGNGRLCSLLCDGLGHGARALEAAETAAAAFLQARDEPVVSRLERIHEALRPTRGGAVALIEIDPDRNRLIHVGLGNIAVRYRHRGQWHHLLSRQGIAGHILADLRPCETAFEAGDLLIMHSDGLTSRWDPAATPDLFERHPLLTAAVLCRDYRRGADDVAVLVIRRSEPCSNTF